MSDDLHDMTRTYDLQRAVTWQMPRPPTQRSGLVPRNAAPFSGPDHVSTPKCRLSYLYRSPMTRRVVQQLPLTVVAVLRRVSIGAHAR